MRHRVLFAMQKWLLELPRPLKKAVVMLIAVATAWFAMWLAFTLRLETWHVPTWQQLWVYAAVPLIFLPVLIRFGLYRAIFRYAGLATLQTILKAALVYGRLLFVLIWISFSAGVPRSVGVLQPVLFFFLVSNGRAWARLWLNTGLRRARKHRLLIYGAGAAGAQTAAATANGHEFEVLGFIDDDLTKVGRALNGVTVHGSADVAGLVARLGVTDIQLALPSVGRQRRRQILHSFRELPVHIRTLPGMADLDAGTATVSDIRDSTLKTCSAVTRWRPILPCSRSTCPARRYWPQAPAAA